jgi:chemotaxis protein CheD
VSEIRVRVADYAVAQGDSVIATVGVGSCIAIALHDQCAKVGGLAHILLPSESLARDHHNLAKFPGTAVPLLIRSMSALGARSGRIIAKISGGSAMFATLLTSGGMQVGERNIAATRDALERCGVPLLAEDVGGDYGRSIYFRVATGEMEVRSYVRGDVVL